MLKYLLILVDKYKFLTKQDLKNKPDALGQAKFTHSPFGKVFNYGLNKKDNTKRVGILQRLKNIEDNFNSNDNNDNDNRKVGIFQIIKDIKDKDIKISNDDEAIREIREHMQNLRNESVRVNNFDEISKEIRDHIQNLKDEGIDVNVNNDQINDLIDKISKGIGKKDSTPEDSIPRDSTQKNLDIKNFLLIHKEPINKPDALEQPKFTYSPLGKVFNDGLNKKDNTKRVGILQRLKNIEDNLNSNDNNDNDNRKVGIFQIIKDIKDKDIKISNDDEAIREIREHMQNLRNEGVRVNNFDEISKEIRDHIQNLKDEGIDVNVNNDQINDLIDKISKEIGKKDSTPEDSIPRDSTQKNLDIKNFLLIHKEPIKTHYSSDIFGKNNIDTKNINEALINYNDGTITQDKFLQIYVFIDDFDKFSKVMKKKHSGARDPKQIKLLDYGNELKKVFEKSFNPSGSGLKILTPQQMLARLPILLAQIKAGNNSRELKNEIRQLLYSLYKSKQISKTVYKNLIATI